MRYVVIPYTKMPCEIVKPPSKPCLDSQIGRQRLISLLFLLRARRVTRGKRTSTIRISPLLPQSGPNACGQRNETGSPETTSKTLSIATSHQPRVALLKRIVTGENVDGCFQAPSCARPCHGLAGHLN